MRPWFGREGSRFWIERPDISIGQIRGLGTLVGGRFVGVVPGPPDAAPARATAPAAAQYVKLFMVPLSLTKARHAIPRVHGPWAEC